MLRRSRSLLLLLLAAVLASAQPRQQNPIDLALQDYSRLRRDGRHDEAAAKRDAIRALVEQVPVEAPQFESWFQNVEQMYELAGKHSEARSMVQAALARATRPAARPARVWLLTTLADSWQRDGYLLKAADSLEQAAAAAEAEEAPYPRGNWWNAASIWRQLGDLYRQLGRPEVATTALAKAATLLRSNPSGLADFYSAEGQIDQAEALYKQLAADARDPQDANAAWQALANFYQSQGRPDDAVAALARALAASQQAGDRNQSAWTRQNLARLLGQAGRNREAEQIYQQLVADPQGDGGFNEISAYAQFLSSTQRATQGQKLLTDYLAGHSDLNPILQSNLLNSLASMTADPQRAEALRSAAAEKWRQAVGAPPPPVNSISDLTAAAQRAAIDHRLDEAFSLSLQAISASPSARDRDSIANGSLIGAVQAIGQQQPSRATEIYRNLLAAVEGWSADTLQPLMQTEDSYIRFLLEKPERRADAPAAIEHYRATIGAANGPESGARVALDRLIDLHRYSNELPQAIFAAQERLRLEEMLSGTTSWPYLNALRVLVGLYQQTGDSAHALPLYRQMIAIADLTAAPRNSEAAVIRINAAMAFAQAKEFDEADRFAAEASAIAKNSRPPAQNFDWQITQIRQMEEAAAPRMGK